MDDVNQSRNLFTEDFSVRFAHSTRTASRDSNQVGKSNVWGLTLPGVMLQGLGTMVGLIRI